MDMREPGRESNPDSPRIFATTHWSVVLAAGKDESAPARTALETLCRAYWYPIYVYVRRKGHGPDEAQDLTEFFAQLISKHHLRLADRTKGKFLRRTDRTIIFAGYDETTCELPRLWKPDDGPGGGQLPKLSAAPGHAHSRPR